MVKVGSRLGHASANCGPSSEFHSRAKPRTISRRRKIGSRAGEFGPGAVAVPQRRSTRAENRRFHLFAAVGSIRDSDQARLEGRVVTPSHQRTSMRAKEATEKRKSQGRATSCRRIGTRTIAGGGGGAAEKNRDIRGSSKYPPISLLTNGRRCVGRATHSWCRIGQSCPIGLVVGEKKGVGGWRATRARMKWAAPPKLRSEDAIKIACFEGYSVGPPTIGREAVDGPSMRCLEVVRARSTAPQVPLRTSTTVPAADQQRRTGRQTQGSRPRQR